MPDTTSGFRAYNREAALQLQVVSKFTYTLETIIQAGKMLVAVDHVADPDQPEDARVAPVPLDVAPTCAATRVSIFRIYAHVRAAARVHDAARCVVGLAALVVWVPLPRRLIVDGDGTGHVQSLILGAVLFIAAVQLAALGVIGDLLAGAAGA